MERKENVLEKIFRKVTVWKKNEKIIICDDSSNNYASSLTHDNDDAGNKEN